MAKAKPDLKRQRQELNDDIDAAIKKARNDLTLERFAKLNVPEKVLDNANANTLKSRKEELEKFKEQCQEEKTVQEEVEAGILTYAREEVNKDIDAAIKKARNDLTSERFNNLANPKQVSANAKMSDVRDAQRKLKEFEQRYQEEKIAQEQEAKSRFKVSPNITFMAILTLLVAVCASLLWWNWDAVRGVVIKDDEKQQIVKPEEDEPQQEEEQAGMDVPPPPSERTRRIQGLLLEMEEFQDTQTKEE